MGLFSSVLARSSSPMRSRGRRRVLSAITSGLAIISLAAVPVALSQASAQSTTPGAALPFTEYDAWTATTNGQVLAPNYYFGALTEEATGRQAVLLVGQGKYVQFTLTSPANAIDVHYSIPDSTSGTGLTDQLSLYVNGSLYEPLTLTSQYSWLYGSYPFTNTPSSGLAHDFYNDVRAMFSSTLPAGTVVKLQVDSGDNAPWYAINVADFYQVPGAISQPSGYLNAVTGYGADPTGTNDSTTALQNAINAASAAGEGLYIPAGTYLVDAPLNVNSVTIEGAGDWYTDIEANPADASGCQCVEFSGNQSPPSTNVNISNLAILGDVNQRVDSDGEVNGFNGGFSNSTESNLWIQNTKVGMWIDGPCNDLTIENVEIMDTTADGVNFDGGVTNSIVENTFTRNTQDDGMAMWSNGTADTGDSFTNDTVDSPGLANNYAIYGGSNDSITYDVANDTDTQGGGIQIANRFSSTSLAGTITVENNILNRTGVLDPNWHFGVGAIWLYSDDSAITGATINIEDNTINNSPFEAFQFIGGGAIDGVNIENNTVNGVGTFVFQDQTSGAVYVSGTTATGVGDAGIYDCGSGMDYTYGSGNSGFSTTVCGFPATAPLWVAPTILTFENQAVGSTSPSQPITVFNVGVNATSIGPITATGGFGESDNCGTTLSPDSSCTVNITFTPAANGITEGTLSIPSGEPGSPFTMPLIGTTGSGNTVNAALTASPTSLTFPSTSDGTTSASQAVTVQNPGTATQTISSISVSGQYTQTNNCGTSLAGNASCTVNVSFAPTSGGTLTGTLSIANSSSTTPLTVALSGTGLAAVNASPTSLTFADQLVGTSSSSQTVTVSNSGKSAASISSISASSNFSETNNCGSSLAAGGSCTVTVTFSPTSAGALTGTLTVNNSLNSLTVALSGTGVTTSTDIAEGVAITASSSYSGYPATNANDGNTSTYWESEDGAGYPQTLTLNFGSVLSLGSVTLDLPPSSAWSTRTETLSVLGSDNDSTWTTLIGSTAYTFNPSTGNTVSFNLPSGSSYQYLQLNFTANTGWSAAQLSELIVYPGGGSSSGPTTTTSTTTTSTTTTSTTTTSTTTPTTTTTRTTTTTTPTTTTTTPTTTTTTRPTTTTTSSTTTTTSPSGGLANLALNQPITASSYTQNYAPTNANDGNTSTYWEGTNGAWPTTLTVDLGTADALDNLVIDLPPSSAWSTRTQTLSVLGSTNYSTWATLVSSATYTWNPSTGNTVTINLPSGTVERWVELSFTANSVQNGAQVSELDVMGPANPDLALDEPITASSYTQNYVASNANDGNTSTYWEGTDGAWPTTLTVNLGASEALKTVVIDLPPSTSWSTRTQTLSVLGSANDSTWTTLVGSATYTWNPSTDNTVSISLPAGTSEQYLELDFTANSVQNGAQVSELSIFAH